MRPNLPFLPFMLRESYIHNPSELCLVAVCRLASSSNIEIQIQPSCIISKLSFDLNNRETIPAILDLRSWKRRSSTLMVSLFCLNFVSTKPSISIHILRFIRISTFFLLLSLTEIPSQFSNRNRK